MSPRNWRPVPPLGHRAARPDATAPDGSEVRFLIDHRHHARGASVVEVTLPPGQVSRPVWHRTVGEMRFLCITIPPWPGPDEAQPADFGGLGTGTV
jgi:hypothetical protein